MAAQITEPTMIDRGPCHVVGAYALCEGDDEPWGDASSELDRRKAEVPNRVYDTLLAFLYRPHRDDPSIAEGVRSCFMGVEVADLDHVPEGMAATRFTGGRYATVECRGETENEAAMAVGEAIHKLTKWIKENDGREGDACFCFSHEDADVPPYVQHVYIKMEQRA